MCWGRTSQPNTTQIHQTLSLVLLFSLIFLGFLGSQMGFQWIYLYFFYDILCSNGSPLISFCCYLLGGLLHNWRAGSTLTLWYSFKLSESQFSLLFIHNGANIFSSYNDVSRNLRNPSYYPYGLLVNQKIAKLKIWRSTRQLQIIQYPCWWNKQKPRSMRWIKWYISLPLETTQ